MSFATSVDLTHAPAPVAAGVTVLRTHIFNHTPAQSWQTAANGMAFLTCGALFLFSLSLSRRAAREADGQLSTELALERRVEQRTRELRQEIDERLQAEHLNRGQKRILEMLADPGDLTTEEILHALAATVASRDHGWECSIFLVEQRGRQINLAASSDVNEALAGYLRDVGGDYPDTSECQAALSGELHIVERMNEVGLPWSQLLAANGIFSVWSVPFCANGSDRLSGVLNIYSRTRTKPEPRELEMAESAARLAGLVIDHRRIHGELMQNAYQDPVTGLPNRRAGEQAMEAAIQNAGRRDEGLAVLWVYINRFKRINDQYGREAGDLILRTIAERLRRNPLCTGSVARMGSNEFLVLIPGTADSLDPVEIARRLSAAIAKPIYAGHTRIAASTSIGACVYPQDGTTVQTLMRSAEFAMGRAQSGGHEFCVFSPTLSDEAHEAMEIEESLAVAIEKNYLRVVYQPLYASNGTLCGFEALLRFHHPRMGNVPPTRFIPIAEESRLIVPIGNWVLREACSQLAAWQLAGLPEVHMSVNISALQFGRDDFSDTVASVLNEFNIPPSMLMLELTESAVMNDYVAVVRQMNLLRQCGVQIAMDDFGTGYSSLSYLHRIPVSVLKIDRSFIEKLTEPEGTRPIVEAVISMAQRLDLKVVAEGVETVEQRNILEKAGCHGYQGYLFARPMPPEEAEDCLKASRTTRFANSSSLVLEGSRAVA
ncbi:MAG TPA: EAL domain-containing protein [Terracidiphilus sp.]|nr:EAL domain-containing protein [Terracidiphilus sp.]